MESFASDLALLSVLVGPIRVHYQPQAHQRLDPRLLAVEECQRALQIVRGGSQFGVECVHASNGKAARRSVKGNSFASQVQ